MLLLANVQVEHLLTAFDVNQNVRLACVGPISNDLLTVVTAAICVLDWLHHQKQLMSFLGI